jgi:4-amino-4-deoxy-L-arabinose transferase-like glycosyltransferase
MMDAFSLSPKTPPQNLRLLQAIAAFFLVIKLIFLFRAGPASDEAYYWLWGRHPALSYFDHPPMQAWLLGLSHAVLGTNIFALRWMTLATLFGTLYIFSLWARRYAGVEWRPYFWSATVIYLASGIFGLFFSVAFQDYLLAFFCFVSAHFFLSYFADVAKVGSGRYRDLYLGAFFLGIAALTKYAAIFLGLGLALTILFSRDLRPLLRNVHLYLAALLAIAMQAPVLMWNATEGFASFRFHLSDRHAADWLLHPSLSRFLEFPLASVLLLSPFLVPVFVRFFLARPGTFFESVGKRWGIWTFWLTTLTFLVASLFDYVAFWWNIPAYLLAMGFAARYMGPVLVYLHAAFGAVLVLLFVFSFTVIPITTLFGVYDFRFTQLYGSELVVAPIRAAEAQYKPDFIASDLPEVANIVAFALDDPEVTSLTALRNQFDYWFEPEAHRGESALIVIDAKETPDYIRTQFKSLTPIGRVDVERFGYWIRGFQLFYAEGFAPNG